MIGQAFVVTQGLRQVMIKNQMSGFDVGQVGGDVVRTDFNLAILHVFGMDKRNIVDQIQMFEQYCTHQAVKITTCNKSEFLTHAVPVSNILVRLLVGYRQQAGANTGWVR